VTSVYLAYDAARQLLYVGLSLGPLVRFQQHKHSSEWWPLVHHVEIEQYETRPEARARELCLIRTKLPRFNKQDVPRPSMTWTDDDRAMARDDPITFRQLAPLVRLSHQRISQLALQDPTFPKVERVGPSKVVSRAAALAYFANRQPRKGRPPHRSTST
jgi:hypothetical protein